MSSEPSSLADVLASVDDPVTHFRNIDMEPLVIWDRLPAEHTNWIEEQRAWRESVALMDQSYHMADLRLNDQAAVSGEEAIDLFERIGVNDFSDWREGEPPQAKQLVMCNPDGYVIADCILFYVDQGEFLAVGTGAAANWIQYNAETGPEDVGATMEDNPFVPEPPMGFRFELMGPNSRDVMGEVVDGDPPELGLFEMDTVSIDGTEVYALGHQMSGSPGVELFGAYEHHDAIEERLKAVGEDYDMRQLGSKSYKSVAVEIGWIAIPVPAVYDHPDLADYREWVDVESFDASMVLGGSFVGGDMSDYYLTPTALGYDHIVDFDHDFIGKEAVRQNVENPDQRKVTLVWDPEDVKDIYASLFEDGPTKQYLTMPDTFGEYGELTRYDEVTKGGEQVGVSKWAAYHYNERRVMSLCAIDVEHSDPGTAVTITWGETDTDKSRIERHEETEVRATVQPSPYVDLGRSTGTGSGG